MDAGARPAYLQQTVREGYIILVDAVDATWANGGAFDGDDTLPDQLADVHVGTVLVHRAGDPAIPLDERPWQAGRAHLDGVRWEEKTWPVEDFIAFRDHVASLMEFTVPGDVRWEFRNLPVVTCLEELDALQSPSPDMVPGAR